MANQQFDDGSTRKPSTLDEHKHDSTWAAATLLIEKIYPFMAKRHREDAASVRRVFEMLYTTVQGTIEAYEKLPGRQNTQPLPSRN